jgi:hypothetical protein
VGTCSYPLGRRKAVRQDKVWARAIRWSSTAGPPCCALADIPHSCCSNSATMLPFMHSRAYQHEPLPPTAPRDDPNHAGTPTLHRSPSRPRRMMRHSFWNSETSSSSASPSRPHRGVLESAPHSLVRSNWHSRKVGKQAHLSQGRAQLQRRCGELQPATCRRACFCHPVPGLDTVWQAPVGAEQALQLL